jgi:hypothetical protein
VSTNGDAPASADIQTLFLVTVGLDGQSRVVLDPEARFTAQRLATPQDVYPALANCLADYQAIKTAEAILSFQTQIARQVQAQAAAEQEHEKTP